MHSNWQTGRDESYCIFVSLFEFSASEIMKVEEKTEGKSFGSGLEATYNCYTLAASKENKLSK